MLGLRYVVCSDCGTVSAVPEAPDECVRCGATELESLPADSTAAGYFAAALGGDTEP